MARNSGRTDRKMPAKSGVEHPYVRYEEGAIWRAVESALHDLVANGDLVRKTNRKYIVGYICKVLAEPSVPHRS